MKLYRIGELAKTAGVSERTIDYYTKLGLISPEERTLKNYRLYNSETIIRLERINKMKQEKYTLEEIKNSLQKWNMVSEEEKVTEKLTSLEMQMARLEREVSELKPLLDQAKAPQDRKPLLNLLARSAASLEALKILLEQSIL
ncbi:MerR family transcriptional regulator [Paenibacillus sp. JX-17]|uniref:MerR family transcriptional regulator n=1 Tax=Paenibacillus lacisoli TaxID=3064525 RepID=A0ABT9C9S2_9BACL|nr:MerR family transcriptional regulator [Paenibacillus sp. JX-17]MDO7906006.1 MerR family transcriptional regulator [Paenibacillus sp. JX-17]